MRLSFLFKGSLLFILAENLVYMKKILILASMISVIAGCAVVPVSGRRQLSLFGEETILSSSFQQYKEFIKTAPKSSNAAGIKRVNEVGRRIAAAAEKYLKDNGYGNEIANYKWEFNLVKSDQVNAFCMPGGKIVVYEGILKYASNDAELATVMSHEVSHALAKHSNERMSQQALKQMGGAALQLALSKQSELLRATANQVYGLGSEMLVILPYSRTHEYEADQIGLVLMAMAGYNPESAISFWQKMAAGKKSETPEFMSTHPSDNNRIEALKRAMPQATRYFKNK